MKLLALHCDTTGIPAMRMPSDATTQPEVVRFQASLCDLTDGSILKNYVQLVKITGTIPHEATKVHGIVLADLRHAKPLRATFETILAMLEDCDFWVAYGFQFHEKMLKISAHRAGRQDALSLIEGKRSHCLMTQARDVCKLPPTAAMRIHGIDSFKTPTLKEATALLLGRNLMTNEIADTLIDLYRHMNPPGTEKARS